MSTVFTWLMVDTHHTFRIVLVEHVVLSILVPAGEPPMVDALKAAAHDGARAVALNWTKSRERAGYRLAEGVYVTEVTVDAEALGWEGQSRTGIGPKLNHVLEALANRSWVLT